jgi:hypothetical protein
MTKFEKQRDNMDFASTKVDIFTAFCDLNIRSAPGAVAFLPDGKLLASSNNDGVIDREYLYSVYFLYNKIIFKELFGLYSFRVLPTREETVGVGIERRHPE